MLSFFSGSNKILIVFFLAASAHCDLKIQRDLLALGHWKLPFLVRIGGERTTKIFRPVGFDWVHYTAVLFPKAALGFRRKGDESMSRLCCLCGSFLSLQELAGFLTAV